MYEYRLVHDATKHRETRNFPKDYFSLNDLNYCQHRPQFIFWYYLAQFYFSINVIQSSVASVVLQAYQPVASGIPNRGIRYTKPWNQAYQTVESGIPNRGIRNTKPWNQAYQTVASGIPNRGIRNTKPWNQAYQTVASGTPNRGIRHTKPWHQEYHLN